MSDQPTVRKHPNGAVEVFNADLYRRLIQNADLLTCGTCGRTWDDAHPTAVTPVPSGRCPFESEHDDDDEHADCHPDEPCVFDQPDPDEERN